MKSHGIFLILLFLCFACKTKTNDQLLIEAARIHNEVMVSVEELEVEISRVAQDSTGLVPPDSITAWNEAIEKWEAEMVEVPGNESYSDHAHGEHHHHDHKPLEVTSEQMLSIQKDLKVRLAGIIDRVHRYSSNEQ